MSCLALLFPVVTEVSPFDPVGTRLVVIVVFAFAPAISVVAPAADSFDFESAAAFAADVSAAFGTEVSAADLF